MDKTTMQYAINPLTIRLVACLTGMCLLFTGCGKEPDPPKPTVITRKITVQGADTQPKKQTQPVEPAAERIDTVALTDISPEQTPAEAGPTPDSTDPAASGDKAAAPEPATAAEPMMMAYSYDPKGKLDPFVPWYEGERKPASGTERKRIPLSPLERVDLSQLKLVGIVLTARGNKALVEESSGKGYVISKGTYIGLNRGKVSKILRDRVIIMESISYGGSGATTRKKELKLQKPPGED